VDGHGERRAENARHAELETGGASVLASRLVSGLAPPSQGGYVGYFSFKSA
jgi:hypothetical protein